MKNLTSKDNPIIKKFKKLGQKKYRREYSSFLVENFVIMRDAYKAGVKIKNILVTEAFIDKHSRDWDEIVEKVDVNNIFIIDDRTNKFLSSLETPSGILLEYDLLEKELVANKPIVYLNGIGDPGNLGTIFRTCVAFGFDNIVLDEKCVDIYNPKTISAAKDAIFKINFFIDKNYSFFEQNKNVPVFASNVSQGRSLGDFAFPERYILVFGSESHGIDEGIRKLTTEFINIEISSKLESLNVASAVAIFLYEIARR